jgi:hypothetical protein
MSQPFSEFSGESTQYTSELKEFFKKDLSSKKEIEASLKYFYVLWDSSKITNDEKTRIINVSQYLMKKKVRPYPIFYNFVVANNNFFKHNHPQESYNAWLEGLNSLTDNKTTLSIFNQVIDITLLLLTEHLLYKSPSVRWMPTDTVFIFQSNNQLIARFKKEINLVCYANRDSMHLYSTIGYVDLLNLKWNGKGGKITWERASYSPDTIYASLSKYTISLNQTGFHADSVLFTNRLYFNYPMLGSIDCYVEYFINKNLMQYPHFESYQRSFFLKNFYHGVDYQGGFAMVGAKLVGKGTRDNFAQLTFYRKDTIRVRSTSLTYFFYPGRVVSPDASITIYLDKDSIYHPALQFHFEEVKRELSLLKSERYTARSPYLNSYHQIDMNFDQVQWKIDEPYIYLTLAPGAGRSMAIFESYNYFKQEDFEKLQYYDEQHPLILLSKFSKYYNNERILSAYDFANYIRKSIDNVHTMLFPLTIEGYILYDVASETIILKEKLFESLKASTGKIDYDALRLRSVVESPMDNAFIDLRNNDLTIQGVPQIFVSDSQNVAIIPSKSQIIMKRNRSFQFDGAVRAGLFDYYGKNFFFQYDTFKIVLHNVDSLKIRVIVGYDLANKPIYRDVNNTVFDATGEVLIDNPNNKSGVKRFSEYPIYRSYGYSHVYYDSRNIFGGVYSRSRNFYFNINPFEIDSLDNFKKESMKFEGTFSSAQIFPDIKESLKLQPDFSLGFNHVTSADGLSMYNGKGKYFDTIMLSNQGLRGAGTYQYLSSSVISSSFLIFPDSTISSSAGFKIDESASAISSYPRVWGTNIFVRWLPYKDQLYADSRNSKFNIYNDRISFSGNLSYTPRSLLGSGTIDMTIATSSAKLYTFQQSSFQSDTANFNIRVLNSQEWALKTDNVKCNVDIEKSYAYLKSNDPLAITSIPTNKYIAKINEFKWWMDKHELNLLADQINQPSDEAEKYGFKDEPLRGARYISVDPKQDSLSFVSPSVLINYQTKTLIASKVKYIDVADARIFPRDGKLTVGPDALIMPFDNSLIIANRTLRYHNIYESTVNIQTRMFYTGSGKYDYIDENNKRQTILFSNISVDSSRQTVAIGTIAEPDSFTLNPFFLFQGDVILEAARKNLYFDGGAKILQNCPNIEASWLHFTSIIDPLKVRIPVEEKSVDLNKIPVVAGTIMAYDSIHLYSRFFSRRKNVDDITMASAKGILWYNKAYNAYEVGEESKLKRHSLPGNLVSLSPSTCVQYSEGKINMGVDFGQCKTDFAGILVHKLDTNLFSLRLSMLVNFYFHAPAIKIFAHVVDSLGKDTINIFDPFYKKNFSNLMPADSLNKYFQQLKDTAKNKKIILPPLFLSTIIFDEINFIYDDTSNSFKSVGKLGIGFINGTPIHKKIDGYVEIWHKHSGDLLDMYFQPDINSFFYFGYEPGKMMSLSSNKAFEVPIRLLPERQRRLKVPRGKKPYEYTVATDRKLNIVRRRWKSGNSNAIIPYSEMEEIIPEEAPNIEMPADSIPAQ